MGYRVASAENVRITEAVQRRRDESAGIFLKETFPMANFKLRLGRI